MFARRMCPPIPSTPYSPAIDMSQHSQRCKWVPHRLFLQVQVIYRKCEYCLFGSGGSVLAATALREATNQHQETNVHFQFH